MLNSVRVLGMHRLTTSFGSRRLLSTAPTVRPLHLLLYTYVDDVLEARKPFRSGHIEAARAASARGEILMGGALAQPADGAVIVFTASEAAERFAEKDPYVLNGIVTDWTVREWSVVVGRLDMIPPVPAFVPTYEWQRVESGSELPPGLDVQLPLDGGYQRARIPTTWQLQVFIDDKHGFLRHDVTRLTTVADVREAAARHAGVPSEQIVLSLGDEDVNEHATAESVSLFSRARELSVTVLDAKGD